MDDLTQLRNEQAEAVTPLLGPLLDSWDNLPRDVISYINEADEGFVETMEKIRAAMEPR